jgi:hypothetical protein
VLHSDPVALALLTSFLGTLTTLCKYLAMSPFLAMTIMVLKAPATDMVKLAETFSRWFGVRPRAGSPAKESHSPSDDAMSDALPPPPVDALERRPRPELPPASAHSHEQRAVIPRHAPTAGHRR